MRTAPLAMRRAAALVALAAFVAPAAAAPPLRAQQVTTVILVRHAERAGEMGNDPGLSPAGEVRARALADALFFTPLTGIVTTQLRRTQLTAAPVARAKGLTPVVVANAGGGTAAHVRAVADTVRARFTGGTVLVVGHSNTVAGILEALGGPKLPDLCDAEFATMFVLTLREGAPPSLVRARYGPEDPAPGANCLR